MNIKALMAKTSITSTMLLWLLPCAVFMPIILGIMQIIGARYDIYSSAVGIIIFSVITVVIFIAVILFAAVYAQAAENKLRHSEQISRVLVENRKDFAIFMVDRDGKIVSWNRGAERLTGYKNNEILGKSIACLYTIDDQQENKPQHILRFAQLQKQIETEGWRVRKNGSLFWATIIVSCVFDEDKKLIGFTQLLKNATRQKEADDRLRSLVAELERSNRDLERFAYVASHDLQEPLRMVASFTQLLEKKYHHQLDQEAQDYIHFAVDGALRMQQLITDLLTYSQISTKGKNFALTYCQVVLDSALHNLDVAIKESHAEITYDELPVIMADDVQMLQLFQNLLSNAIKFNKYPPKIHVSAKLEREYWLFTIQDNGIGIDPEYQEQIFLIFQRLHGKQEYQGTGMGLAICKKIVERHGGEIWVESELGEGAKFCFTIPV